MMHKQISLYGTTAQWQIKFSLSLYYVNCFYLYSIAILNMSKQERNHLIDIGGVQMWALPQIYFF